MITVSAFRFGGCLLWLGGLLLGMGELPQQIEPGALGRTWAPAMKQGPPADFRPERPGALGDTSLTKVSYTGEIVPLFTAKCNLSGCHHAGSSHGDFTTYQAIYDHREEIVFFLETGFMPTVGTVTTEEIQLVKDWVSQGATSD
jgi:hypothetical protein